MPPTPSISARPSATPAASRWPASPTSPGTTSWRPPSTTARSCSRCSRRWVPSGSSTPRRPASPTTASAPRPIPESRHVIGTARMGDDPDTSVVDRWGRVHSLDNVVVADSSVFVTSSGYGPTLTLVALAAPRRDHLTAPAGLTEAGRRRQLAHVGRQRTPRVSSMVPAMGPPPLATAATSGTRPPGRTTWRSPPSPRSCTQASWISAEPVQAPARELAARRVQRAAARRGRCWRRPR